MQCWQFGPLFRVLRPVAELLLIEGQLPLAPDNKVSAAQVAEVRKFIGDSHVLKEYARPNLDGRGWRTYDGLDDAFKYVEQKIVSLTDGDGADVLIGFSQGGNLISCLAARAALGIAGAPPKPYRGVVILSPGHPGWAAQLPELFANKLTTPAIVGHSTTDTVATGHAEVAQLWSGSCVTELAHGGPGHRPLPGNRQEQQSLVAAVERFVAQHCPQ